MWIGTEGGGIDIYDTKKGTIQYLQPGDRQGDLSGETIYAIYQDKESRKWIGTHKGGLNIIDSRKTVFQTIAHDPLNSNSLVNNFGNYIQVYTG